MGVFTDELNKIRKGIGTSPVPKISVPTPIVKTPTAKSMDFRVGEGLTPDQVFVASGKVRVKDEFIPDKPYSFSEALQLHRSSVSKNINPTFKPTAEDNKQVFSSLTAPLFGATSPLKNVASSAGKVSKEFIQNLVKETNPAVIETRLRNYNLPPEISGPLSRNLAGARTTEEVKNILINTDVTPKLPGTVGPMPVRSKIPLSGQESPQDLLALAEKNAAQKHLKFDMQGKPVPYTAKERELVGRNVPFMPKAVSGNIIPDTQFQPRQQQSSPIDTTTGEGRSLEIAVQNSIAENNPPPSSSIVDNSLEDIISKEPTPVKNKVNIIDYIRTPDRVLKKIGLEEEGNFLRTQHDKYLKELPKNIDKVTEWSKRASPTGNQDIFNYLDGKPIDLKPQDKIVAEEIKGYLKEWADRLGLPQDNRIAHYITHIFDQELIAKEFPEELAKLIDNKLPGEVYDPFLEKRLGTLGYRQDTWAALDAYIKRATRKVHMDPALAKIKDASGKLEKSQHDYVKSYISNINMRPGKTDTLIDNGIKQIIGYKLGQRPLLTLTRFLRQMTYRAFLGLNPASALKNISQGINTYSQLGEKYTTIGYINLFKKGAKAELETEGILNAGFIEDRALSSTKKAIEKFDKVLFYFFEKAEHINRGAAYFGAKAQGISKGMSEQEAIKYAKEIVRKTQFVFGKIDTPMVLSSDLGKTLGQFQSFTTKQIEFLLEMSKKAASGDKKAKNFIGLLRYALAGTVFVYTIGQAFNMKITDLIPAARLGTPPSLKLPVETTKAILGTPDKYGNERSIGQKLKDVGTAGLSLIPASTQIKKTYQGYKAMKEGASKDAAGRSQFDVGGTPLKDAQALIFGKYSGEGAKDYYENDLTYAEAKYKELKKSPETAEANFDKIIQENPSLAENILKVIKDEQLGIDDDDKKLRNLGVANKARAQEVAKQFNKLDNKEDKAKLWEEYVTKKIITEDVAKQLPEFLK